MGTFFGKYTPSLVLCSNTIFGEVTISSLNIKISEFFKQTNKTKIGLPLCFFSTSQGDGSREGCRRLTCDDEPCYPGVPCEDTDDGCRCGACPLGLTGDGTSTGCHVVTESGCGANPCFPGVECTETQGTAECGPCPTGYHGDGHDCYDINEVRSKGSLPLLPDRLR